MTVQDLVDRIDGYDPEHTEDSVYFESGDTQAEQWFIQSVLMGVFDELAWNAGNTDLRNVDTERNVMLGLRRGNLYHSGLVGEDTPIISLNSLREAYNGDAALDSVPDLIEQYVRDHRMDEMDIMLNGQEVEFHDDGSVSVGCTDVSRDTLEAIFGASTRRKEEADEWREIDPTECDELEIGMEIRLDGEVAEIVSLDQGDIARPVKVRGFQETWPFNAEYHYGDRTPQIDTWEIRKRW